MTIVSPASTLRSSRERWVLASCTVTSIPSTVGWSTCLDALAKGIERPLLDLADSLAGDAEALADLVEGHRRLAGEPVPQLQHGDRASAEARQLDQALERVVDVGLVVEPVDALLERVEVRVVVDDVELFADLVEAQARP